MDYLNQPKDNGEYVTAAVYLITGEEFWPWRDVQPPENQIDCIILAGQLIAAEAERLLEIKEPEPFKQGYFQDKGKYYRVVDFEVNALRYRVVPTWEGFDWLMENQLKDKEIIWFR